MTQAQQPEALQTAIRLLRDAAQELAEGISVRGVPDWKGEPDTADAYDETMAAVVALEAHQAEHIALQQGYDAARLEIESLQAQLAAIGAGGVEPLRKCLHQIAEPAQTASAAVAGPSETVKFVDESTADPVEKARRYLKAIGDQRMNSAYFFDDGYPRREISQGALATLAVLEQLAAAPTTQVAPQPAVQQWNDLIGKETHADADGLLVWRDEVDFAIPTVQAAPQQQELLAEIQRLQRALAFWLPMGPSEDHPLQERIAHDAFLLAGYYGTDEPSAYELGHVALAGTAAPVAQGDALTPGLIAAAEHIEGMAAGYIQEHAYTEPDTGAVVFDRGDAGLEYHSTLIELADDLRQIAARAQAKEGGAA